MQAQMQLLHLLDIVCHTKTLRVNGELLQAGRSFKAEMWISSGASSKHRFDFCKVVGSIAAADSLQSGQKASILASQKPAAMIAASKIATLRNRVRPYHHKREQTSPSTHPHIL